MNIKRILQFTEIDTKITIIQVKTLVVFTAIAIILSIGMKQPTWAVIYMGFGSLILSTTPFAYDSKIENGFLALLPAKNSERIGGRYLYFLGMVVLGFTVGILAMLINVLMGIEVTKMDGIVTILAFGGIILFGSLQMLVFYQFGKHVGQQLIGIIRLVPGLLFFVGMNAMNGLIRQRDPQMKTVMTHLFQYRVALTIGFVIVSVVVFILSIAIANRICQNRDLD